jgi:hypothetical protein
MTEGYPDGRINPFPLRPNEWQKDIPGNCNYSAFLIA